MRSFKPLLFLALLAAAASPWLQAQTTVSVADLRGTAQALQALQEQQKAINDNQAAIDTKLADIAERMRVARLFQSRAK